MALVARIDAGGRPLVVYNVHLESQIPESGQVEQVREVIAAASRLASGTAVVIAGDFNTRKRDSAVIEALRGNGYRNALSKPRATVGRRGVTVISLLGALIEPFRSHGAKQASPTLDWIFLGGPLTPLQGSVLSGVTASDHYPLVASVRWKERAAKPLSPRGLSEQPAQ